MQDGRAAGSITPAIFRKIIDSLAGSFNGTPQTGASYTAAIADRGIILEFNSASAQTLTIPTNANAAFDIGTIIGWYQMGVGVLTIAGAVGVTVRTSATSNARAQFSSGTIRKRATDEWVL